MDMDTGKTTLLSLPGELRNLIWRNLVVSPEARNVEPLCQPDRPKLHQPAIAFTSKSLREEVLSLFYAENSFYLGKIGYHDSTDIRLYDFNVRLRRWSETLGPHARNITHLRMVIDGLCYAWDDGVMPGDATYEMRAEREGRLRFAMNGRLRCTCRLRDGVVDRATRDGRVLLDVMREYGASYCEAVREGRCEKCGRSRLERIGRAEVAHQRNWEDIATTC